MFTSQFKVEKTWIDHNDHMNVSYYQYVFQEALNQYWKHILNQEDNSRADLALSPKNVHIRYLSEALLDQTIDVHSFIYKLNHEGLSVFQEMKRDDTVICIFSQDVNFCSGDDALIRQCANVPYNILSKIVEKTDIVLPKWIDHSIEIS